MIITQFAEKKIAQLMKDSDLYINKMDTFLRVGVSPGGCAGLRYQIYFDYTPVDNDKIVSYGDFKVHIDPLSTPYLEGATLDYVESIEKIGFIIDNPNAQGGCSCGDSFN